MRLSSPGCHPRPRVFLSPAAYLGHFLSVGCTFTSGPILIRVTGVIMPSPLPTIASAATSHAPVTRGLRLLALDGGGIRGISSLMILNQLMEKIDPENPPKPCDCFDLIGGTSTGGIIAIMLG